MTQCFSECDRFGGGGGGGGGGMSPIVLYGDHLGGVVVKRPPREPGTLGSLPAFLGRV